MAKNFEHIIHKNSSALIDGNPKLPTSGQLEYGEIAVNYAKGKETISLKNSNNEIVTFTSDKKLDNYVTVSDFEEAMQVASAALNDLEATKLEKSVFDEAMEDLETQFSNFYTKEEIDNAELVTASALNDLEESKADKDDLTDLINNVYTKEEIDNDHLVISSSLNDLNTRLNTKQDTLVSGTNIKTINNQSILGSGNITLTGGSGSGGGGDINVIESVKVNGSALTPDANKAVNITAVPASIVTQNTTHRFVSDTEKTTWNGKQDALTNADVLTGITSTKVSNWDNAATNSHTHSNKSVLDGISSTDITNWNSKTDNVGTVTGVKMNGTTKNPTSGVVDLGTVITSETTLSKGSTSGSGNAVTDISVSGHQITLTKGKTFLESETQLSKGTTTGTGNAVTDVTVSGHKITLTKGTTFLTQHQSIKTLNGTALTGTGNITLRGVPAFSASDNGKILGVVNGQLAWVTPTTIYTGSGTPSSSTGNDGDIYLQTS